MARDSSGNYSLPLPPVEADEVISSAWMNATLNDLATAITESVPVDGSAPITGQTKIADGSNAAPGLAFNAESSTGLRRPEANTISVVIAGTEKLRIKGGNLILGSTVDSGEKLQVSGNTKLAGNLQTTGNLTVEGSSVQHGDIDARGNVGADGYVQGVLGVLSDGNIVSSAGNVVAGGNVYATLNLMGQRVLVNAGTLAEPSINFNGYGAGFYFPTSGEVEAVGDGVSVAKFGLNKTEVNDTLVVRGTGAASAMLKIGDGRATSASAVVDFRSSATATNPDYDFRIVRNVGDNGAVQFVQNGTGRMQFQSAASEYRFTTTSSTTSNNYTAATTSADNGAYCTALTSAGTYQLMFKNAALNQSLTPYLITRSATGGASAHIWRVGGDITTSAGSLETFRITDNNRFLIGNAADAIWTNNTTDISPNYYFHGAKLGGGSATISMGSEQSFDANLAFSRNNTSTKRVIIAQIVGNMSASAAGLEAGQIWFQTKDGADSAATTRLTLNGSGANFAVPIIGRLNVHSGATTPLFAGATDITADYPVMISKSGGGSSATATGVAIGSNNVDRSTVIFNQTNSAGTRIASSRVVGINSATTAGAEKGYLVFDTKGAADASPVGRLTLSETSAAFTVPVSTTGETLTGVGSETVPSHSFAGDTDTGMYRSSANNLDFSTGGVRRFQIDSSGRLYGYSVGGDLLTLKTTANNGLLQIDTTSGTANINNLTWYLTSAGSALLILRNDAKSAYISPIAIQRNASSGTSNVSFRVGGDANVNGSDVEAGRFVISPDGTQGKLLVGHTAQDVYLNNADVSPTQNFQIHSYKTGGNGPVSLLGTDGTNTSYWASARTNTASKRVIQTQIGGVSVSSTAGAERGRLDLATKAAADAGVVVRCSIDETAAAFTVPVTASNLSYATKVVSASLVNDGITSIAAGLTINTSDCAAGRVFQIYNNSAASITITQGAGLTMRLVGTATTGNRTIAQRGLATFTCISGTEVVVEGAT